MKKRLFWLLALVLSLLLTLSLASCDNAKKRKDDDDEEDEDETEEIGYEVTSAEWINAIELTGITSLTVDCELDGGDEGVLIEKIKFCNGLGYMSAELNGEPMQTYYIKMEEQLSFTHIISTGDPYVFINVINEYPDYAYEQFEYDEDGGYYEITHIDENESHPVTYNIRVYFGENKFISKIDISSECDGQTGAYSFLFSKYNSTDAISIPSEDVSAFMNEHFPVSLDFITISNSTLFDGLYGGEACDTLNNLIASIDLSKVVGYHVQQESADDTRTGAIFEVPSGSVLFGWNEITFEGITIDVSRVGEDVHYDLDLWNSSYDDTICHIYFGENNIQN